MAELIGQMAAFDQEGAGTAPNVLAVLLEADFGQFRHGDQETLFPLVQEVALVPPVEQAVRDIAGYRNGAERPGAQDAAEVTASGEGNVQRKVGFGDDFLPKLPPTVWGNVGGRVSGLHVTHSEFSRNRTGTAGACRAVRHGPVPSRPAKMPCNSHARTIGTSA